MLSLSTTDDPSHLRNLQRLRFLLRDSVLYGGASAISKAFSLITFPLLARHFSVAEYGVLDYFLVLASFLAILFIFGQDSAVARYFYEYEDASTRCQLISQSLLFQLTSLALLIPLLLRGAGWLSGVLIESPDSVRFFRIVLLQVPFLLLINFSQNLLKWTFARARFLIMSLGFTVVQASLLVIAVLMFDVGIEGVLLVSLTTNSVFGMLGLYFVRHWLAYPRNFRILRSMVPYAIPLGVICVLGAFSPTLERTLTVQLLGAQDLGLYAAGTKIAMLIGIVVNAFQTAWGPFALSLYKQSDAAHTYNWVLKLFAMGICSIVFALTLAAQPLIHILASDRYEGAAVVVFPLAIGLAIQATSWITEIGIGIAKRSYLNLYAYMVAVSATLGGIVFLGPVLGLLGVSLGVMFGHIARAVIASKLAQRAYPLPWDYKPILAVIGLTLLLGLVATWVRYRYGALAHSLALAAALLTVIGAGWRVLFNTPERQQVVVFLRSRLVRSFTIS